MGQVTKDLLLNTRKECNVNTREEISKKIDRVNYMQNTLMQLDDQFAKLKRQLFQLMQEMKSEFSGRKTDNEQ